nr:Chain C, SER-GLY-VAL-THR-PHE-GLN [Severe acute respiratory syndrome coronavirus 2]7MB5_D Chain D, SER-GLY-VAL-THR-PHE-GLN [Severe acute respiratory syndrome coronavirus 2]
SGVTFQ